ncbi:MAG TPA: ABC transporter permease [Gemmataceae bacterium]|nr:ABC transporter permease [Gemmataceae bacterium]
MSFLSAIRVAWDALLVHKGRSFLTSLGIVIGVSAVIAMVSAGEGARFQLEDRLASLGKNLIMVRPGNPMSQVSLGGTPLTNDDAHAIRQELGYELTAVSELLLVKRLVSRRARSHPTAVTGCTPNLSPVRGWHVRSGRFISDEDNKKMANVCIIGVTLKGILFPGRTNILGQTVRMEHLSLRVIGEMTPKGRSPLGYDQDDQMWVPLTVVQRKLGGGENLSMILTSTPSEDEIDQAKRDINDLLRKRRHVQLGNENFDVSSVNEITDLARTVTTVLQLLVAIVAAISLVVGGIGVMNIMLVSVTERTREIGIRTAVGATPANVLAQFLIEAVVLALAGGLIGTVFGLVVAVLLAGFVGWPLVISPLAVLAGCGVSVSVGVFFGYYPAWRASRLEPIQALRHE